MTSMETWIENLTAENISLQQRLSEVEAEREKLELEVRRMLFFNHGHQGGYGDDGELQCGLCAPLWDYRRTPLDDLQRHVMLLRLKQASEPSELTSLKADQERMREALEGLKRYAVNAVEHHGNDGITFYAYIKEEEHPEGNYVKWEDVATLTARCEALEQENAKLNADIAEFHDIVSGYDAITDPEAFPELHERAFRAIGDDVDHTICRALAAAEARCEALTAERDAAIRLNDHTDHEVVDLRARCQHLEQAAKEAILALPVTDRNGDDLVDLHDVIAALASLLTPQEGKTASDETRAAFAAGYSTAIDDVIDSSKP